MQIGWLRVLSVLFAALALIFSGAHLLELPHKIGLSASDYLTAQQLYRGWQLAGIVVVGAVVSIVALAYAVRNDRRAFVPTLIALLCILGTQAVFWMFNFPANQATDNWATLPADWEAHAGVGIANVRARLHSLYGDAGHQSFLVEDESVDTFL